LIGRPLLTRDRSYVIANVDTPGIAPLLVFFLDEIILASPLFPQERSIVSDGVTS
jgi:hypothetical protein